MSEEIKDVNKPDGQNQNSAPNAQEAGGNPIINQAENAGSSVKKWKEVLYAMERKLAEERAIYQNKIKEIKEAYDGLKLKSESREKELSLEAEKYKESSKVLEERKELLARKNKEDEDSLNNEWEARLKAKDNEIFSIRNELNVIHNRDEEEMRSLRHELLRQAEEARKQLDLKGLEIIALSEDKARLNGRMAQRETELKAEFERTIYDLEKRIRSSLESEINRLKISLEQEKTANDVMQIKLKEMATLRADLEFKENHIRNIYGEKQAVEKMKAEIEAELQTAKIEFERQRTEWDKVLQERNGGLRDLLRDKDNLNTQIESYKNEVKEYQLKIEAREREWERKKSELEQSLLERNKKIVELEAFAAESNAKIESLQRERQAEQEKIDKALSSDLNRVLARLEMERGSLEAGVAAAPEKTEKNQ